MREKEVIEELSNWIKPELIAEELLDVLHEQGRAPTSKNAKKLYLDFLEHSFNEALIECANYIFQE